MILLDLMTELYILIGLGVSVLLLGGIYIWWMKKNNILFDISTKEGEIIVSSTFRGRAKVVLEPTGEEKHIWLIFYKPVYKSVMRFFAVNDYLSRSPIKELDYEAAKKHFVPADSIPLIGHKKCLNAKEIDGKMYPWSPPVDVPKKALIPDYLVSWSIDTMVSIYENNKVESNAERIYKIVMPISLVILAVFLLLFAPQIIDKIKDPAMQIVNQNSKSFVDALKGLNPIG